MRKFFIADAFHDLSLTLKNFSLVGMMGWKDVRHRYKRSSLGPFWLTLSMGIMITTMSVVFSKIFNTPLREFLPFISISMILWGYISNSIIEGAQSFIEGGQIIKQLPLPLFLHVARIIWRNTAILVHNLLIFPIVILLTQYPMSWIALWSIPGYFLLLLNLTWIVFMFAILCARYRDLQQLINSILQIVFYITPIMWMPNKLSARASLYLVNSNPVYHILSVARMPLLGSAPSTLNWTIAGLSALIGWGLTLMAYSYTYRRIAYWI